MASTFSLVNLAFIATVWPLPTLPPAPWLCWNSCIRSAHPYWILSTGVTAGTRTELPLSAIHFQRDHPVWWLSDLAQDRHLSPSVVLTHWVTFSCVELPSGSLPAVLPAPCSITFLGLCMESVPRGSVLSPFTPFSIAGVPGCWIGNGRSVQLWAEAAARNAGDGGECWYQDMDESDL